MTITIEGEYTVISETTRQLTAAEAKAYIDRRAEQIRKERARQWQQADRNYTTRFFNEMNNKFGYSHR
ncbi:MAG: hypothetical protein ACR2QH_15150 [Geminicoccaceae bacterium]